MVAHRLLSSVISSNEDDNWLVHSLMLPLHDLRGLRLRRLLSTVPCSMILAAYRDDRHDRTMITGDAWQLTIKVNDVRRRYWPVTIHICSFCRLCVICQASSCSFCVQSLGFLSPDPHAAYFWAKRQQQKQWWTIAVIFWLSPVFPNSPEQSCVGHFKRHPYHKEIPRMYFV